MMAFRGGGGGVAARKYALAAILFKSTLLLSFSLQEFRIQDSKAFSTPVWFTGGRSKYKMRSGYFEQDSYQGDSIKYCNHTANKSEEENIY